MKEEKHKSNLLIAESGNTRVTRTTDQPKHNTITTFQKHLKYLENYTLINKEKDSETALKIAAEKEIIDRDLKEKSKWERLCNLYSVMRLPGCKCFVLSYIYTCSIHS